MTDETMHDRLYADGPLAAKRAERDAEDAWQRSMVDAVSKGDWCKDWLRAVVAASTGNDGRVILRLDGKAFELFCTKETAAGLAEAMIARRVEGVELLAEALSEEKVVELWARVRPA